MKKTILGLSLIFLLASCGSEGSIDTVERAAQTYCKAAMAAENASDQDKTRLKNVLNDLEDKIEEAHKGDKDWFRDFENRVEEICQKG